MPHDPEALSYVLELIEEGSLDGVEREIYDAIRDRSSVRALVARGTFKSGDAVVFNDHARKLHGLTGVVMRRLPKNILVRIDDTPLAQRRGYAGAEFRCHPELMERAS